ncbi:MAG: monovalent cation/H+ antiporter complex subunit F [Pseudomonadota bacterium]
MTGADFIIVCAGISGILVAVGVTFSFIRLARGPSIPDRVVALDMMTVAIVAICGIASIISRQEAYLDVALVLALVGFLANVALARYAERRRIRRDQAGAPTEEVQE